jgi:hypothetical protein
VDMVLGTTVQPCTVKVMSCCTCAGIFVCVFVFREVDGVVEKILEWEI